MSKKPFVPPPTISRTDFLRAGSDSWFRETIYSLTESVGSLSICREAFARHLDLSPTQFIVLMGVAQLQDYDGVTIRRLAEHISLAPTHTTTEVGRLTRKKLLVKKPSATDGRSVLVTLSPAGEKAVESVAPFLRRINDLLFRKINAKELEVVKRFCTTLIVNAEYALTELRRETSEAEAVSGSDKRGQRSTSPAM